VFVLFLQGYKLDIRLEQQYSACRQRFASSRMLQLFEWQITSDVSEDNSTTILRISHSKKKFSSFQKTSIFITAD